VIELTIRKISIEERFKANTYLFGKHDIWRYNFSDLKLQFEISFCDKNIISSPNDLG